MDRRRWFVRLFSALVVPLAWPVARVLADDPPMRRDVERIEILIKIDHHATPSPSRARSRPR